MKKILLPLICLLLFATCKKEEEEIIPSITYPIFEGYILRNDIGDLIGIQNNDTTDWKLDNSNWLDVEKNLFTNYDNLVHNYNSGIEFNLFQYPNPITVQNTNEFFGLNVFEPDSTISLELRFINQQFTKLKSVSLNIISPLDGINFKLDSTKTSGNELIRAYYMFTRNDTCFHKGFGDIMFK